MDFFGHTNACPAAFAFVQQKYKFLHEGWDYLFHPFVSKGYSLQSNICHGYRLLTCDGSDINIARNPDDEETYIHEGNTNYNAIHVNALYDLTNNTYCDFLVQGKKKLHECSALNTKVNCNNSRKKEGILQELAARMILYNFCELVTNHAAVQTLRSPKIMPELSRNTVMMIWTVW